MRIVKQTPQQLLLKELKPRIGLLSVFGLLFWASGVITILTMGEWVVLRCDCLEPSLVDCSIENRTLLHQETRSFSRVTGAEVETIVQDEGANTYRVRLLTERESVPLTQATTSGRSGKQKTADTINAFMDTQDQATLEVRQDFRWRAYSQGGGFSLIGIAAILFNVMPFKRPLCQLDRTTGRGRWQGRQGFILLPPQEFSLDAIQGAKVITYKDDDSDKYAVHLILKAGKALPIHTGYIAQEAENLAETINHFLSVQPNFPDHSDPA